MGFIAKDSGGGDFELAPVGTHPAVCVKIIDIGTQWSDHYKSSKHKVLIGWELCGGDLTADGKPFLVWGRYTMSLHENAALRPHLEAWRGKAFTAEELDGFDILAILGKPCLVNISHRVDGKKTYVDVASVMALMKGAPKPTATMPLVTFDADNPDMDVFATFSEKLQQTIQASEEWKARGEPADVAKPAPTMAGADTSPMTEDEIPFSLAA